MYYGTTRELTQATTTSRPARVYGADVLSRNYAAIVKANGLAEAYSIKTSATKLTISVPLVPYGNCIF